MATIKLGLIGSWASRAHLGYFSRTDKYKITAVQNSSQQSAKKSVEKYNLGDDVATYGDVTALASDPNVDLIVVCVKVPEHFRLCKAAIDGNKTVFVEWPLGANLEEAQALAAMAKEKHLRTIVGLQARQDPSIRKAREIVLSGDLGDIMCTYMVGHGNIFGPEATSYYEYLFPIENGANLVTIPASHAIDALCYVLGEFKDLQATLANNRPKIKMIDESGNFLRTVDKTAHDHMSLQGTLARGGVATVVYQASTSRTGKNFYWEINGTKGSLALEGPDGHVQMNHPSIKIVKATKDAVLEEIEVDQCEDYSANVGVAWDAFVGQGPGSVATFEDAVLRHKMIDAIYKSNSNGSRESYV